MSRFLGLLLSFSLAVSPSAAQQSSAKDDILRAVLQHIRAEVVEESGVGRPVLLNPRPLNVEWSSFRGSLRTTITSRTPRGAKRTDARMAAITQGLGVVAGEREDLYRCSSAGSTDCSCFARFVEMSEPVMHGDGAIVFVFQIYPDSNHGGRPYWSGTHFTLHRTAGAWTIVDATVTGQS